MKNKLNILNLKMISIICIILISISFVSISSTFAQEEDINPLSVDLVSRDERVFYGEEFDPVIEIKNLTSELEFEQFSVEVKNSFFLPNEDWVVADLNNEDLTDDFIELYEEKGFNVSDEAEINRLEIGELWVYEDSYYNIEHTIMKEGGEIRVNYSGKDTYGMGVVSPEDSESQRLRINYEDYARGLNELHITINVDDTAWWEDWADDAWDWFFPGEEPDNEDFDDIDVDLEMDKTIRYRVLHEEKAVEPFLLDTNSPIYSKEDFQIQLGVYSPVDVEATDLRVRFKNEDINISPTGYGVGSQMKQTLTPDEVEEYFEDLIDFQDMFDLGLGDVDEDYEFSPNEEDKIVIGSGLYFEVEEVDEDDEIVFELDYNLGDKHVTREFEVDFDIIEEPNIFIEQDELLRLEEEMEVLPLQLINDTGTDVNSVRLIPPENYDIEPTSRYFGELEDGYVRNFDFRIYNVDDIEDKDNLVFDVEFDIDGSTYTVNREIDILTQETTIMDIIEDNLIMISIGVIIMLFILFFILRGKEDKKEKVDEEEFEENVQEKYPVEENEIEEDEDNLKEEERNNFYEDRESNFVSQEKELENEENDDEVVENVESVNNSSHFVEEERNIDEKETQPSIEESEEELIENIKKESEEKEKSVSDKLNEEYFENDVDEEIDDNEDYEVKQKNIISEDVDDEEEEFSEINSDIIEEEYENENDEELVSKEDIEKELNQDLKEGEENEVDKKEVKEELTKIENQIEKKEKD